MHSFLLVLVLLSLAVPAQALVVPDGWTSHRKGSVQTLSPPDAGFWAAFHDEESLAGWEFAAWFEARADTDMRRHGTPVRKGTPKPTSQGVLLVAADVQEAGGPIARMVYSGVECKGNAARFIVVRAQLAQNHLQPLMAEGSKMVAQIAAVARNAETAPSPPAGTPSTGSAGHCKTAESDRKVRGSSARPGVATARPGSGVSAGGIEAVVHDGEDVCEVDGYRFKE